MTVGGPWWGPLKEEGRRGTSLHFIGSCRPAVSSGCKGSKLQPPGKRLQWGGAES